MNEEPVFEYAGVEAADPISLEDVKPLACRGCLAVSRPLRPLERATAALYGELVGTAVRQADIYPKFVCNYCHALLLKFKTFRDKCRSAQATFLNLHSAGILITRDLLQSGITGIPFPNLKETWPQLLYVDGVQENPCLHEVPITDIAGPVKDEQLDHVVNPDNVFNNHFVNKNDKQTRSFSCSVEQKYVTPVTDSIDAVNVSTANDNAWHNSDVSGEDSDMPDCLAGFKSDIYKNDTKQNFKVEKPIPTNSEKKRNTKVKVNRNVKNNNSDLDTFKSWINKLKAKKVCVNKRNSKTNESCVTNVSISAGTTDDGQMKNVKKSCNDDDIELVTDATDIVSVDTDSENNCLDDITDTETTPRKKAQGKASKDKKKSKSDCTLREVRKWVEKMKDSKTIKQKKSKLEIMYEKRRKMFEKNNNVKMVPLSKEDQIKQIKARKENKKYKEANYKCEMCYHVFNNKITLQNHMTKHELSQGDYVCDICSVRYPTQLKLKGHQLTSHLFDYICNECGVVSKSSGIANSHWKWHKGVKYSCKICDKSFDRQNSLSGHMHLSHGGTVECSLCNEMFSGKHGLSSHMALSHKDAKGAVCPDCNTQFHNVSALQRHLSVGCDVTRSPCVVCGEGFTTGQLLEEHMQQVHTQIYKCDQCGKQYDNLKKYKTHVSNHDLIQRNKLQQKHVTKKQQTFICEICGASRSSKNALVGHIRVHTGEKPFECAHCNMRFKCKYVLKNHTLQKHTPDQSELTAQLPQYACPLCDRQFSMKANRNRHIKTVHEKQRPYACDACGKTYPDKSTLQIHINTKHLGMPWPKRIRK